MKHLGPLARLRLHKVRILLEVGPQDLVPRRSLMELPGLLETGTGWLGIHRHLVGLAGA